MDIILLYPSLSDILSDNILLFYPYISFLSVHILFKYPIISDLLSDYILTSYLTIS